MRNLWLILTTNFKEKFSHGNYERHFLKKFMMLLDSMRAVKLGSPHITHFYLRIRVIEGTE